MADDVMEELDYAARMVAMRIAGDIVVSSSYGSALKKWREYFEVSQNELARVMGVSTSVISDYEKGRRMPGARFIRRFVAALIAVDRSRGWKKVRHLAPLIGTVPGAIIDLEEFEEPVTVSELSEAIEGIVLGYKDSDRRVYGYTVVHSIKAILSLSGLQFMVLFGLNPQRAMVFTNSQFGRSPLVAVRASPIKPASVVIHGPKRDIDPLAVELARLDGIPLIVTMIDSPEELVDRLRSLASSKRFRLSSVV